MLRKIYQAAGAIINGSDFDSYVSALQRNNVAGPSVEEARKDFDSMAKRNSDLQLL